jgi:hypothetical protein
MKGINVRCLQTWVSNSLTKTVPAKKKDVIFFPCNQKRDLKKGCVRNTEMCFLYKIT